MSARPLDLIAAARQRLAVQRHWRAVARADGPASIELYQLLLNAAAGADVQAQANELLGRMAVVFAKFNAEAA